MLLCVWRGVVVGRSTGTRDSASRGSRVNPNPLRSAEVDLRCFLTTRVIPGRGTTQPPFLLPISQVKKFLKTGQLTIPTGCRATKLNLDATGRLNGHTVYLPPYPTLPNLPFLLCIPQVKKFQKTGQLQILTGCRATELNVNANGPVNGHLLDRLTLSQL